MRDSLWTTAAKRKVRVCDMNTHHLRNTLAMMEREVPQHYLVPERNAVPIYHEMKAELAEREKVVTPLRVAYGPEATERAVIERERAAFIEGLNCGNTTATAAALAAERYSFTVTEPRVVQHIRDNWITEFRYVEGRLESRLRYNLSPGPLTMAWSNWVETSVVQVSQVEMISDLKQRPTTERAR